MKVLATVLAALTLTVRVSAWYGQVTKGGFDGGGGYYTILYLDDFNTGSTYSCDIFIADFAHPCPGESNACSTT